MHARPRQSAFFRRCAFTLVEVLVAIGMMAAFMTLLSFFLVGLSSVWLNQSDNRFFENHVDGVMLFLHQAIESAAMPDTVSQGDSGPALPVEWARPPGFFDLDDPLLFFELEAAPALFVREGLRLPRINAYLFFEQRQGLSILWYSNLEAEEVEDTKDLFNSPVSPLVSNMEYAYYDAETDRWDLEPEPMEGDDGAFLLPDFIRLTFSLEGEEPLQRSLYIPKRNRDFPLF